LKPKIRNSKQYQNLNVQNSKQPETNLHLEIGSWFKALEFGSLNFVSDFDIRISDFANGFIPCRFYAKLR